MIEAVATADPYEQATVAGLLKGAHDVERRCARAREDEAEVPVLNKGSPPIKSWSYCHYNTEPYDNTFAKTDRERAWLLWYC